MKFTAMYKTHQNGWCCTLGGHEGLRMYSSGEAAAEIAKGTKYGRTIGAAGSLMLMSLRWSDLSTKTFWKLQRDAERIMSDHRHERHQLVRLLTVQPCHLYNMSLHTQTCKKNVSEITMLVFLEHQDQCCSRTIISI